MRTALVQVEAGREQVVPAVDLAVEVHHLVQMFGDLLLVGGVHVIGGQVLR